MSETETVLPPASLGATSASMRFVAVDQSTCPEGAPAGVGGSDPSASLAALFHRLPPASRGPLALFPGVSHRRLKDRHDLTATYAAFLNCHLRKDLGACAAVAAACAAADVCEMPPPTPVSTA